MRNLSTFLIILLLAGCGSEIPRIELTVTNPTSLERKNEIVELPIEVIENFNKESFIITDQYGKQLPFQITYDNKLIFPATVTANRSSQYLLQSGTPEDFPTMATGKHYPERVDDIAWENDRIAFRTYGPALQATGERAFGYDIWVKRVPDMVVEERYHTELNPETRTRIEELKKTDPQAAQELANSVSYHIDHGNGLDYYSVGPTLGAGTSALWIKDDILYPYCYRTYEVLDNGPLRFTVKLTYHPLAIENNQQIIESRLISLDAGSQLNKIAIQYDNLESPQTVVTGIVLHNSNGFEINKSAGYIAYAEEKDPVNGQTYVGAVFPAALEDARPVYFPESEKKQRGAEGHLLAFSNYQPGSLYTYYAGGGWNKWGFETPAAWYNYIQEFTQKVHSRLQVTY